MKRFLLALLALSSTVLTFAWVKNYSDSRKLADRHQREEGEAREEPGFDYFYAQRAYPYGRIDYAAHQRAARVYTDHMATMATAKGIAQWQPAGPNNIGGRISDIAMHPTNQNIAWLAASSGGIFKTTDGGTTWFPVFDKQPSMSMGAIAVSPSNPDILSVGTGEANGGSGSLTYEADGAYKSVDGGATWTHLGLDLTRMTGRMAVHPANPDIAFAATMGDLYGPGPDRGLYRTADGGLTWTKVLFLTDSTGCIDVVINPQNPNYVFAAMFERSRKPNNKRYFGVTSGLWRSTDGGLTWSQLTAGLPPVGGFYSRIGVDLCTTSPNVVYAQYVSDSYEFLGLYKSVNNGDTWTQTNDGALANAQGNAGYWYGRIQVDPVDPNTVYVIGFDMYKTTDGGNSWNGTFPNIHVDQHCIAIHPLNHNLVMNGNDGGLHISTNGGTTWIHHEDLPITQFYTCELNPGDPKVLVGGTQDNNTVRTTTGSFYDWEYLIGGDGFYALIDPVNDTYWYGEFQYGNIFRSDDGGQNFSYKTNGLNGSGNWNTPIVFDPSDPQTLYTGYQQVFKTTNRGDSWNAVSPPLTTVDPTGNLLYGTITTIDVSPVNPSHIYAGTDDGKVWHTASGGGSWTDVTGTLPSRWVTRVTCDPAVLNRAYVTLSGYRFHDAMAHVYMTGNAGATWQAIDGNLPDIPCNDIIADPNADSVLYLATDAGVYHTLDLGATWSLLGTGMPVLVCTDLRLHAPTASLLVATYGRGMYKLDLSAALGIEAHGPALQAFSAWPVPAKDVLHVSVGMDRESHAVLTVYDVAGRKVETLYDGPVSAGQQVIDWHVTGHPEGTYLVRLQADQVVRTTKVMVSR